MKTSLPIADCRLLIENRRRESRAKIENPSGFSLIEIMVVISLLAMIILGLTVMFNQTQRAFRTGMNQVDVLEGGRMATDLIAREMAQTTPANLSSANFYVKIPSDLPKTVDYEPLVQSLPGSDHTRLNVVEDVFFIVRENQTWKGIGYFVRTNGSLFSATGPVGTLYRFETNMTAVQFKNEPSRLFKAFRDATTASKILDGVVHFRVRAFDPNFVWLTRTNYLPSSWPADSTTNFILKNVNINPPNTGSVAPEEVGYYAFYNNAMPASVELEIGILESRMLEKVNAIGGSGLNSTTVQRQFLKTLAGSVHVFRRQIPIRNVDLSVYP